MGDVEIMLRGWATEPGKPPMATNLLDLELVNRGDAPRWVLVMEPGDVPAQSDELVALEVHRWLGPHGGHCYQVFGASVGFRVFHLPARGQLELRALPLSSIGEATSFEVWDVATIGDEEGRSVAELTGVAVDPAGRNTIDAAQDFGVAAEYEPEAGSQVRLTFEDVRRQTVRRAA